MCAFGFGERGSLRNTHTHARTSWRENIRQQNKQRKTGISEDALSLSDAITCALMIVFFSMLLLLSNLAHKLNYRLCPYVLKRGGFLFHKPAPSSSHHYYTTSLFRFTLISCVSFCVLCFCLFLRISNVRLVNLCLPTLYMDPFNPFRHPTFIPQPVRSTQEKKHKGWRRTIRCKINIRTPGRVSRGSYIQTQHTLYFGTQ